MAIIVAATSACAAPLAKTVTLSAIPSEKLRPRQPLVAMPRTRVSDAISTLPGEAGRCGSTT
ncbi:MAG TPA: hypothetical protein VLQ65_05510, partial [Saliniramus sp.]|nr:hypothetical protein [Saliniramus sp.]